MIARLKGIVEAVRSDSFVLDVNGVGYLIHCASTLLGKLPMAGSPLSLYIETQVREDSITLYGFEHEEEREWFRLLMSVQGVGAKVALAILGVLGAAGAGKAVALQDKSAFARSPGVGPKLAARIANELKDKIPRQWTEDRKQRTEIPSLSSVLGLASSDIADALSALVNLGYKEQEASAALARVRQEQGEDIPVAELIRNGLRELTA